jgi:hypothetical protein
MFEQTFKDIDAKAPPPGGLRSGKTQVSCVSDRLPQPAQFLRDEA